MKMYISKLSGFKIFSAMVFIIVWLFSGDIRSQSWSSFGNGGMNDWVYASTIYNGDLIVGGKFTSAGGVSANHIARWDGSSWFPLGLGVNAKVNTLLVHNGMLYVGGEFTEAGGLPMMFIAMWDGTQWLDDLGDLGSIVTSLAIYNNTLVAGGYFIEADGVPVNYIAQHTINDWEPLGTGMGGSQGQVMDLYVHNNELIAAGFFTTAGGMSANHIAKWNGTNWSPLGSGISGIVYSLGSYNGNLVAGGLFLSAGGTPANHIAMWDGTAWSPLGSGMSGTFYQYVLDLDNYNGDLVAGGYFTHSDGVMTNGIAKWNGTSWSAMGGGLLYPANVYGAHTLCNYGTSLIVGGLFSTAGGVGASHIASWYESPSGIDQLPATETWQPAVYPNPVSNITSIEFVLPQEGTVFMSLTDASGREVFRKFEKYNQAGSYTYPIDATHLESGIYILKITSGKKNEIIKIIKQ